MISNDRICWVCSGCGIAANYLTGLKKYGQPPYKTSFDVSTYHDGVCDVCRRPTRVTEARDFFYPDFELLESVAKSLKGKLYDSSRKSKK